MTLMSSLRAAVCALIVFFAASELPVPASAAANRLSFARTGAALLWVTIANVSVANRPMIAMDSQP
jgi:hypothetical protein